MARYKRYDLNQRRMIPIALEAQILPGSFEHTLMRLIDEELDLRAFDHKYKNDENGAPAYDPRILLKIVLYAYSKAILSSRRIAQACEQNIVFMALSADSQPHFTTIADFISGSWEQIGNLLREVLLVCDELGLIGTEMFAIDGCKIPSNASKEWSGKRADFQKNVAKLDGAIAHMLATHKPEPVFGNITSTLGMDRFTLRGREKVNGQWNLFAIVHNIGKIKEFAPGFA